MEIDEIATRLTREQSRTIEQINDLESPFCAQHVFFRRYQHPGHIICWSERPEDSEIPNMSIRHCPAIINFKFKTWTSLIVDIILMLITIVMKIHTWKVKPTKVGERVSARITWWLHLINLYFKKKLHIFVKIWNEKYENYS